MEKLLAAVNKKLTELKEVYGSKLSNEEMNQLLGALILLTKLEYGLFKKWIKEAKGNEKY